MFQACRFSAKLVANQLGAIQVHIGEVNVGMAAAPVMDILAIESMSELRGEAESEQGILVLWVCVLERGCVMSQDYVF